VIKKFYNKPHGIYPVYLKSKYNYASKSVENDIAKIVKRVRSWDLASKIVIIYFIDTDSRMNNQSRENEVHNTLIKDYCENNKYELVTFVRNIEQVLLAPFNKDKVQASKNYREQDLNKVPISNLSVIEPREKGQSNILRILDRYLIRN